MAITKIEWADYTFNPWIGCTNCYAERDDHRRHWTPEGWGKGKPRKRTSAANWRGPLLWDYDACKEMAFVERFANQIAGDVRCIRRRVFCASLADWLDDEVPIEWLADLLSLIHDTPRLDWLLLTKRPENWQPRIDEALKFAGDNGNPNNERHDAFFDWLNFWNNGHIAPKNVWVGTSVENQAAASDRIPRLLEIPAAVRFLSVEPMLGPITLGYGKTSIRWSGMVDWVICGGESGPNARPMHPDWARSLRDQCRDASVPFFFKQWGEYIPVALVYDQDDFENHGDPDRQIQLENTGSIAVTEGDWNSGNYQPRPELDPWIMERVGKRAAGRLLDGREWSEFPTSAGVLP